MIAILYAIWTFLVALGPFLTALAGVIASLAVAVWEIVKIGAVITLIAAAVEILFDKRGKTRIANLLYNLVAGGLGIVSTTLKELAPTLNPVLQAFVDSFDSVGPAMRNTIAGPIGDLAKSNFNAASKNLTDVGESTQDNAISQAANAFKQAFGFGIGSAAVTAAFEACFPEKLNVLNGVGPAMANMAGFEEIAQEVLRPLYHHAFGQSLDYHYRSLFRAELPDEGDAVRWHSRGLLSEDQLKVIFDASGLKREYEPAYIASAYRPVPPFLLARAAAAGAIPAAALDSALIFNGFRPQDITMLELAYKALSLRPFEVQYLSAAERSVELGTDTPESLARSMNDMGLSPEAQNWVQLTVAERKLQQLAELYRKSVSESYKYGTISDADYVPALEAIGIASADAQAHYAIDSIAKQGKVTLALVKEAERLAKQQQAYAMRAAVAQYHAGALDDAALEAALLAAGIDPTIAGFAVVINAAKRSGPEVFVYGILLPRRDALVLREQVTALEKQVKSLLVTDTAALAQLAAWNIPAANAEALVADWAAFKPPKAPVGVKLTL